ncbi:hypothetical protein [Microbaculum sp. FT89]|uniref:hypothetical protein n=1 Tax=Microbaculum sp. FT89 TaxID=3447298 RepID=UPI003F529A33
MVSLATTTGLRRTALLGLAIVAGLLGGCQTNGPATGTPPTAEATPPVGQESAAAKTALAFEPVVGIPEDRATVLATELGAGAAASNLPIIGRDKPDVTFRIKGYFNAVAQGGTTKVSYVWDIFNAEGTRVHRISGSESVPAALPDPWSGIPDETLKKMARQTVDELRSWLDSGAPTTALASDPPPPGAGSSYAEAPTAGTRAGLTKTQAMATGRGGRIPDAAALHSAAAADAAAMPEPPRFTYFLSDVAGATGDGAKALTYALSGQLEAAGGARVATPRDADYVIGGEATVAPPVRGSQIVAIIWSVADRGGKALGSVRQIAKFAQGALDAAWGTSADTAAASAAPGVLALIPQEQ